MLQSKITNRTAKSSVHLGRPWLVSRDVEIDLLGPSEMLFTKQRLLHVTRKDFNCKLICTLGTAASEIVGGS